MFMFVAGMYCWLKGSQYVNVLGVGVAPYSRPGDWLMDDMTGWRPSVEEVVADNEASNIGVGVKPWLIGVREGLWLKAGGKL